MRTRVRTQVGVASRSSPVRRNAYSVLSGLAALTSAGIWLLMVVDDERSVGAATLEMVVKFTNLTVVSVVLVAAAIARGWSPGRTRAIAHLTVMVMAIVTALVNATLLDPALPSGWWGVVDLAQHYVIPIAVVALWAMLGPPVGVARARLGSILIVPLAWLVIVLARGAVTEDYPYDFLDPAQNGRLGVAAMIVVILVLMVAVGGGLASIDRRRERPSR